MTLKLSFRVPDWLARLVAPKLTARAKLLGHAGRDWRPGNIIWFAVKMDAN